MAIQNRSIYELLTSVTPRTKINIYKIYKEYQIISIGLRTWVSPVYQAPYAVISSRFFRKEYHSENILRGIIFRFGKLIFTMPMPFLF